jgi:hypothetical protein
MLEKIPADKIPLSLYLSLSLSLSLSHTHTHTGTHSRMLQAADAGENPCRQTGQVHECREVLVMKRKKLSKIPTLKMVKFMSAPMLMP